MAQPGVLLADAEASLRTILDHTNDVIVVLDVNATIRFASASAKWLLEFDPEEQIGRSAFDFIHPDDMGDAIGALDRSVAAGPGPLPRKVIRVRHGDGTWRWVELSSYGMLDDPLVQGIVVTVREVRDRLDAARCPPSLHPAHSRTVRPRSFGSVLDCLPAGPSVYRANSR
jgi:PAS domain S-box-containing protein